MFGAQARDEMDKAVKFVDRYAEFLTPANAEISWFGKNMLLKYYRTKQLGPLEVCALALAVAPDARDSSRCSPSAHSCRPPSSSARLASHGTRLRHAEAAAHSAPPGEVSC